MNAEVIKALKNDGICHRPKGSPGIWLSFLLPSAIVVSFWRTDHITDSYTSCAIYSANTLLNVCYLLFHMSNYKTINVTNNINVLAGVPCLITISLYSHLLNIDLRRSLCYTAANALMFFEGLPFIMKVFPRAFTFGEANIAIQGISLFIYSLFLKLNNILIRGVPKSEQDISTSILLLALSWILVFCIVPFTHKSLRSVKVMYLWGCNVVGLIFFSIYHILDCNVLLWIWSFLTKPKRIGIVVAWFVCSVIAFAIVQHHISVKKRGNTYVRKYFHGLVVAVFVPGIIYDANLLHFSSGCVLGLFVVLEVFRILNIPPLSDFLKAGFSIYCDEKDSGALALTPICLLIGASLPIWLFPISNYPSQKCLPLLSGVLSVGVGDTFASLGGKMYGKHKWKDTFKTVEGTIFGILSQVLCLQILAYFGFVPMTVAMFLKCLVAICVTSLVEAKTNQIDNIVLPLTMYTILML